MSTYVHNDDNVDLTIGEVQINRWYLPNFKNYFTSEEIEELLSDAMECIENNTRKSEKGRLIELVADSGYKSEPDVDEDGKPSSRRTTLIHRAARLKCRRRLIDNLFKIYHRFDVNPRDESGLKHYHVACKYGLDSVVEEFLEYGEDPNIVWQETGDSPLHLALKSYRARVTALLLRNGADPNYANKLDGSTALHLIVRNQETDNLARMLFLLSDDKYLPVQLDTQDNEGKTALYLAVFHGREYFVRELLRRGADPNLADNVGVTPLHLIGKKYSNEKLARNFFETTDELKLTLRVDARDERGRTPLQLAVANVLPNTVDVLLNRGADLEKFIFPVESDFDGRFNLLLGKISKMKLTAGLLAIVGGFKKKGYELRQSDTVTIVKVFLKYEIFEDSTNLEVSWYDDEEFASRAKKLIIKPSLSLYDLIQLQSKEAARLLTHSDYYNLVSSEELWKLPEGPRNACASHLCEKLSKEFFLRLALDPLWELIHYRLPSLCCELIMDNLMIKDLCNIYLAARDKSS